MGADGRERGNGKNISNFLGPLHKRRRNPAKIMFFAFNGGGKPSNQAALVGDEPLSAQKGKTLLKLHPFWPL